MDATVFHTEDREHGRQIAAEHAARATAEQAIDELQRVLYSHFGYDRFPHLDKMPPAGLQEIITATWSAHDAARTYGTARASRQSYENHKEQEAMSR